MAGKEGPPRSSKQPNGEHWARAVNTTMENTSLTWLSRAGSHDDPALVGMSPQERKKALNLQEKLKTWKAKMVEWDA